MSTAATPTLSPTQKSHSLSPADELARWRPVLRLPCLLTVDVDLPGFKVRNFLALRKGSVLSAGWSLTRDVPLRVNGTLIGWGELEGTGQRLTVRVTELA